MSLETWPATRAALSQIIFTGTSPPPAPYDGQEWIYPVDATNGINWRFRYNASGGTYKWEFIGGSVLSTEVLTDEAIFSPQTAYQEAATRVGITIPRAGDYMVVNGATMYTTAAGSTVFFTVAASAWSDNDSVQMYMPSASTAVGGVRTLRRTFAASDIVIQKYRNNAANATNAMRRWMTVQPVRIA